MTTYQAGDEIDINGTAIVLISRRGSHGIRWTWGAPDLDIFGESHLATPEEAIAHATRTLGSDRCRCGAVATMTASTRRTCVDCYDRHAD